MTFSKPAITDFTTNAILATSSLRAGNSASISSSSNGAHVEPLGPNPTLASKMSGVEDHNKTSMMDDMKNPMKQALPNANSADQSNAMSSNQFALNNLNHFSLSSPHGFQSRTLPYSIQNPVSNINPMFLLNQLNMSQPLENQLISLNYPLNQPSSVPNFQNNNNSLFNGNLLSLSNLNYPGLSLNQNNTSLLLNNQNHLSSPSTSSTLSHLQELAAFNNLFQQQQQQSVNSYLNTLGNATPNPTPVPTPPLSFDTNQISNSDSSSTQFRNRTLIKRPHSEQSTISLHDALNQTKRSRSFPPDAPNTANPNTNANSRNSVSPASTVDGNTSGSSPYASTPPSFTSQSDNSSSNSNLSDFNKMRKKHITTDRQRRAKIKDGMHQLRELLLSQGSFTSDQVSIMNASVQLIKTLTKDLAETKNEVKLTRHQLQEYQQRYGGLPALNSNNNNMSSSSSSSSSSHRKSHKSHSNNKSRNNKAENKGPTEKPSDSPTSQNDSPSPSESVSSENREGSNSDTSNSMSREEGNNKNPSPSSLADRSDSDQSRSSNESGYSDKSRSSGQSQFSGQSNQSEFSGQSNQSQTSSSGHPSLLMDRISLSSNSHFDGST
jgi:hypothetical protein